MSLQQTLTRLWQEPRNRVIALLGGLLAAIGIVYFWALSEPTLPPLDKSDQTLNNMNNLNVRIIEYVGINKKLPDGLPEVAGDLPTNDVWDRPYVFTPGTAGSRKMSYVLRSLGADGQPESEDDFVTAVNFGLDTYKEISPELNEIRRGK